MGEPPRLAIYYLFMRFDQDIEYRSDSPSIAARKVRGTLAMPMHDAHAITFIRLAADYWRDDGRSARQYWPIARADITLHYYYRYSLITMARARRDITPGDICRRAPAMAKKSA